MGLDLRSILASLATNTAIAILDHYAPRLDETFVGRGLKEIGWAENDRVNCLQEIVKETFLLFFQTFYSYDLSFVTSFFHDPMVTPQIWNHLWDLQPLDPVGIEAALTRHARSGAMDAVLMQGLGGQPEQLIPAFFQSYRQVLDQHADPAARILLLTILNVASIHPGQRIIAASNPATPAHLLEHLARDQDAQVRESVASNPNTSWPILEQLAWEFPYAFLHNPAGLLQLVARPGQITVDKAFWEAVLRVPVIPPPWWNWLRDYPSWSIREAAHLHIQYAEEESHSYGDSQEEEERLLLTLVELLLVVDPHRASLHTLAGQLIPLMVNEYLHQLLPYADEKVKRTLAENPQMVEDVLQTLSMDQRAEVRSKVAGNPQTPKKVLQALALDEKSEVRRKVAGNLQTPGKILQMLARDEDKYVRKAIARHPQTSEDVLRFLALDQEADVREAVAQSPQTSADVLQILAKDEILVIRITVAKNQHTPLQILQTLAPNQDEGIQYALSENPQTPGETLRSLASNEDWFIRENVASHPRTPVDVLQMLALDEFEDLDYGAGALVRQGIARNKQTSVEILQFLAKDKDTGVRRCVAWNRQTPVEVLQALAQDEDKWVRRSVVGSGRTPAEILPHLSHDQDTIVRFLADLHVKLLDKTKKPLREEQWYEKLILSRGNELGPYWIRDVSIHEQLSWAGGLDIPDFVRQTLLDSLLLDWDATKIRTAFTIQKFSFLEILSVRREYYRYLMAPFLPPAALQKLADSPIWEVRFLVALHDQTSQETRQRLCEDGNRYVRFAAGVLRSKES